MKSWVEVPATINTTDLETHNSRRHSRYEVCATYDYEFNKQQYSSNRVTLVSGLMFTSSFNRDAFAELKRHRVERTTFRCYVRPDSPTESILYRDLPGDSLVNPTVLATIPGSIGTGLVTLALLIFAFAPKTASRKIANHEFVNQQPEPATKEVQANDSNLGLVAFWMAIGVYWSIASLPLDRKIVESISKGGSIGAWLAIMFPIVGLLLVTFALKLLLQARGIQSRDFLLLATKTGMRLRNG